MVLTPECDLEVAWVMDDSVPLHTDPSSHDQSPGHVNKFYTFKCGPRAWDSDLSTLLADNIPGGLILL